MSVIDPIVIVRETAATPEAAWRALVEPDLVARWFTSAGPVGSAGDPYRLDFGDSVIDGVITEIVPGRRLGYTWRWADTEPPQETVVTWEIEALRDGGSRVIVRHGGWDEAGADESSRDDHAAYWSGYLDDLADLLASDPAADASGTDTAD
jgi:uncharacterized protein YndB with AHSA1/START domain